MNACRICLLVALAAAPCVLSGCIVVVGNTSRSYEGETRDASPRRRIGVELENPGRALAAQLGVDADRSALVSRVLPGSPADRAGIVQYDVITGIGATEHASIAELRAAAQTAKDGEPLCLKLVRAGRPLEVTVVPAAQGDWNK